MPGYAADFYAGKRLSILVNYDVGGSNDIEARLIARHIGRHIPGEPPVIVQNMSGAGGMVGARWLGEKAPRDGTVAGFITAAPQRYALNPERYKVDLRTYQYVAYMPNGRIHFVRTNLKPGIKTGIDVVGAQGVVAGGLSAESPKDLAMRLVLDMLGANYKYVTGYNSAMRALLAFQRNEINLWSDSASFWLSQIEPLARKGEVVPICFDPYLLDGTYVVPRQLRPMGLTSCPDLLKSFKGGMPTGDKAEAYRALLAFSGVMYRTFVFPPEVPSEAVNVLRKAMLALNDDQAYQDDATKTIGEAPEYISSPDINAQAAKLMTLPPNVKSFLSEFAQRGKP
jgi:tripartite-type tricarboxylate transporter receptor subunit TctC